MPLPDKLRRLLFAPSDRVLVAVSGGPDSLSLLHVLWTEREARGLAAVEAAHLDHGLRGAESAAEAAWVAAWCEERGIPCHLGRADVAGIARERKWSKQEAARTARYAFLEEIAAQTVATKIATGHTRDDQVETVLMNVLRGAGMDGLRGIPARRGLFVRPLLDVSRAEIEDYCAANGLEPRRDPSNLSPDAYTRNRVRLELLPLLARDYNPAVAESLLRLSEIAGRDLDYLQMQANKALAETTRARDAFRLVLDRPGLAGLHPALLRYVLRRAISDLRGTGEGVTYEHLEQTCRAVAAPPSHAFGLTLPFPLCTVCITNEALTLTLANVPTSRAGVSVSLSLPGAAMLPGRDWTISAGFAMAPPPNPQSWGNRTNTLSLITPPELGAGGRTFQVLLDAAAMQEPLTLRHWRRGDRVDPLGMGGKHKKVSDIFADAKVPRAERHTVPIVADAQGIVWVVGHCIAERVKVTPATQRRLCLVAEREGAPTSRPATS